MSVAKVLAIDGPSGSGKSYIAHEVAKKLGILYVDTGAMYRAIGLYLHRLGIEYAEEEKLEKALANLQMLYGKSEKCQVEINGNDLTEDIREHHVSKLASQVSQLPSVRSFLLGVQRKLALEVYCVMEGRDIGTVVFPDAFCKVFLTASAETRAQRRLNQLKDKGADKGITYERILQDIILRDQSDSNREIAPLKQAEDAIVVNSDNMSREQVLDEVIAIAKDKAEELGLEL